MTITIVFGMVGYEVVRKDDWFKLSSEFPEIVGF